MVVPDTNEKIADYLQAATAVAQSVADPELPFLTVHDLGILREVSYEQNTIIASVSPTYSGCPAVAVIENSILAALTQAGFSARIERVMSPPWTSKWITATGRKKLLENGIAPPAEDDSDMSLLFAEKKVSCPQCQSADTQKISDFGSTPCKAQYRCNSCLEPFDYFKCH